MPWPHKFFILTQFEITCSLNISTEHWYLKLIFEYA